MLLEVKGLRTYFSTAAGKVPAVDGVDLHLAEGKIVGLVGESGCGKSVTALSILGLVAPPGAITEGQIFLRNTNLLELNESDLRGVRRKEIAYIPQDASTYLNPIMRIREQVAEAIDRENGESNKSVMKRATDILRRLQITDAESVVNGYPHQLSGGMAQRVLIGIAVARLPSLIIADEPTTQVDATVQANILHLFKEINEKYGMSILMITHDFGVASYICDSIYVMYAGKVVESGDVFSIFREPKHPYTQGLLQCVTTIYERKEKIKVIEGSVPNLLNALRGCLFHPRCHYAMEKCVRDPPPQVVDKEHTVACWLYDKEELSSN